MASPLPTASSPPASSSSHPTPANKRRISNLPPTPAISTNFQPNKKAKIGSPAPASASRKNSFAASKSTHPLRQTSFPPDEAQRSRRSPSVSSNATTSFTRGNSVDRVLVPVRGKGEEGGEDDGDDDEDDGRDDYGTAMLELEDADAVKEDQDKAREDKRMLLEQFDEDQMSRYEYFRRGNLNKPAVKKVANQVLNQSITANVATVISGFSKVFAGDLIERARDIQAAWGDDKPGSPLMPEHIREAARRMRLESGKSSADPLAAMVNQNRPKTVGAMGGRLFR